MPCAFFIPSHRLLYETVPPAPPWYTLLSYKRKVINLILVGVKPVSSPVSLQKEEAFFRILLYVIIGHPRYLIQMPQQLRIQGFFNAEQHQLVCNA